MWGHNIGGHLTFRAIFLSSEYRYIFSKLKNKNQAFHLTLMEFLQLIAIYPFWFYYILFKDKQPEFHALYIM